MTRNHQARPLACLLTLVVIAGAQAQDPNQPPNPDERYKLLLREFQTAAYSFFRTQSGEERKQITARVAELTSNCLALAEQHPSESFALEALTQVVTQEYWLDNYTTHPGWGNQSRQAKAIALILRDHPQSSKLGPACKRVHFGFRPECETFLRTVLEKNPHRDVQGLACLRLAQFLAGRLARLDLLTEQPSMAQRFDLLYGPEYMKTLRKQDPSQVMQGVEKVRSRDGLNSPD